MMWTSRIAGFLVACAVLQTGLAQGRRAPEPREPSRLDRLERFKKMRLVEALKLNEDEAVRFFAKQSVHDDKVRDLMKDRNQCLDDIQDAVRSKMEDKDVQKLTDKVIDVDQKVFAERQRYQAELRGSLTAEQFARFLVFERSFEHRMREAVQDMIDRRQSRERDW